MKEFAADSMTILQSATCTSQTFECIMRQGLQSNLGYLYGGMLTYPTLGVR